MHSCRDIRAAAFLPPTCTLTPRGLIWLGLLPVAIRSPQAEEAGAVPGCAGDGAGNGREAAVGRALPDETVGNDGDGVALAPILAHEDGAGLQSSHQFGAGLVPAGIGIEQFGRCAIK